METTNIDKILGAAASSHIELWFEGDRLRFRAPAGKMPDELRANLSTFKNEILAALREQAATTTNTFPLSFSQQAMWFMHQNDRDSAAYNVAFTSRICSPIKLPALQTAFQTLVDRHPVLRTTYKTKEGVPFQVVIGYAPVWFQQIDATAWNEDETYAHVRKAYLLPFDLENGPLFRVHLFTRSENDYILLITVHHIAVDGWSMWILLDEARMLYEAALSGTSANLPRPPATYQDFVTWQLDSIGSETGETLWKYWQEQLIGSLPVLSLPTDHARPPIQTTNGASVDFVIPAELTKPLKTLAKAEGVTLYMLLCAVFQILLHRYTGQNDIITGLPTFGRSKPEYAKVVGDFINMISLRVIINSDATFREFLTYIRQRILGALEHQDYPFSEVVAHLGGFRDASRTPVFQVTFDVQRLHSFGELSGLFIPGNSDALVDFGGMKMQPYHMPQQEGQFDLGLILMDADDVLPGAVKYNTDIFDERKVVGFVEHFLKLLEAIVANPDKKITLYEFLTDKETQLQTIDWNQTQFNYPANQCLHQLFETQAQRTPHAVAVVYEDKTITYAQLNARANQLAHHLISHGAHGLVGICMERSIEVIIAFLGVLKAGAAYVPIDPGYPADRLAWMIADSQIQFLLIQENLQEILPETTAQLITLDTGWAAIASQSETNPNVSITPESLAYIIYTSGSTGKPKGVMIPHRAIVSHIFWANDLFQATEKDVFIQKFPFSFDPSVWEVYAPLVIGAKLVMAQPGGHQDGNYIVQLIQEQRVTLTLFVPSLLQLLVETPGFEQCTSLRCVGVGGEALSMALVRSYTALNPAPLINLYGPTETTITTLYWRCEADYPQTTALIGRPVGNTTLYILDKALQLVPLGVPGELHIGGVQVGAGYFNRPELTAERFIPNPFSTDPQARLYKTGDLARYRPDGMVEFLGRNDSQVKIRGFRIELGEIEAALSQHPAVTQAVVVVREDVPGDKRLTAYYTTSAAPSARELSKFLRDKLPAYMLPSAFVPIDAFPQSPSGKIDARQLPAPVQSAVETHKTLQPPSTPAELLIAEAWKKVLKVEQISTFDNFFDLGGHSLLGMRVVNEIKEKTGHRIEPAYLRFESLGQLAARLEEKIRET